MIITFPFYVYLVCSRLFVKIMSPNMRMKIKDTILDVCEEQIPKGLNAEGQEKTIFYIGLLRDLTPEQFFGIVRLTKHTDFSVFLYLLDCVREDFKDEMKNYKVTKK